MKFYRHRPSGFLCPPDPAGRQDRHRARRIKSNFGNMPVESCEACGYPGGPGRFLGSFPRDARMAARKKAKKRKAPAKARHAARDEGEAKLSARPIWQGHLRLSLVSCPVALYGAASRANDVSFHLLNPKTNNRIRMVPTDPDTGPIERADLVKGYEISKNSYVVVTPKELDAVKLETTHTIDIERFVDANDIDRLFWNNPYYLVPNEKTGLDAYTVI